MKDKRERFITIAERRVPRAIREIRLIGNLADTRNYTYSAEEAQRVMSTLEQELKILKGRFAAGLLKGKPAFKLQREELT